MSLPRARAPHRRRSLRDNDQLLKGNKSELVERAEECYANGALARCTECGGGRYTRVGAGPRWQYARASTVTLMGASPPLSEGSARLRAPRRLF